MFDLKLFIFPVYMWFESPKKETKVLHERDFFSVDRILKTNFQTILDFFF